MCILMQQQAIKRRNYYRNHKKLSLYSGYTYIKEFC